jgi:hypothetical protein
LVDVDPGVGASLIAIHDGSLGALLSHPLLADVLDQERGGFATNLRHGLGQIIVLPQGLDRIGKLF